VISWYFNLNLTDKNKTLLSPLRHTITKHGRNVNNQ
jgi:hypothetical protein